MSVTTETSAPQAQTPARERPTHQYLGYLFFTLCAGIYLLPFMRLLLQGTDEGLFVYDALRLIHGQVFARDFSGSVGPGSFYWMAAFFKVFGVSFLATRISLFISCLGIGLLMYFLSRRICNSYRVLPCIILAGTSFGMLWPTISHHVDSNFFALLAVACMAVWKDMRKNGLLLAAGVLAGATTWFLQPKGMLLLVAFLMWLWILGERRLRLISSQTLVMGGYCGVIAIVLIYFWSQGALWNLIGANFLWPSRHYGDTNAVPYAQGMIQSYWDVWAVPVRGVKWTIVLAAILIIPFGFVAALPGLIPILGALRRRTAKISDVSLYWLCGWALWLSEIHRKDICHLVFGSPLLIVLAIYYLQQYRARVADVTLQILAISGTCLAGFNFFLVLSAHPTATRVGSVAELRADPVLELLNSKVPSGSEIFVYPYCPMYYFLSATTNPTRYDGLVDEFNTASQFQEVIRVLDEHRVRYVVWNTSYEENALKSFFPGVRPLNPHERIMEPYLESRYKAVWSDDTMRLMERKSEDPQR